MGVADSSRADHHPESVSGGPTVLFDILHPAHVHLFRNVIHELEDRGAKTFVASRIKDVTVPLLDAYEIDHVPLTRQGKTFPRLVSELAIREARLLSVALRVQPDVMVSRINPATAHVSRLVDASNVFVKDTRIGSPVMRAAYRITTDPFVDRICAPPSFDLSIPEEKRRPLDFQELAYLHPRYFDPDPAILEAHGVDPESTYFVIRLAGWDAHHDIGHRGISPSAVSELVSMLSEQGTVYISAEKGLPEELSAHRLPTPPAHIHAMLYHADLYVGDSGTMSTEAAILGTPSVRTSSLVGKREENVFRELEDRYGLLRSFADERRALAYVRGFLEGDVDRAAWRDKREQLIDDKPDVTHRILDVILEDTDDDDR